MSSSEEYARRRFAMEALPSKDTEKEEKIEEEDPSFNRAIEQSKEYMHFRYGELSSENKMSKYLQDLVAKLPEQKGFPIKDICVLTHMPDKNAMCFPDGTIMISSGLLKYLETEEELLGILAHEYVHAYREHIKSKKDGKFEGSLTDFAKSALKKVGSGRAKELQADLEGVYKVLDSIGVSPLGLKSVMTRLARDQRGDRIGAEHGGSMDRALNINTATYLVDFQSLADLNDPVTLDKEALSDMEREMSEGNVDLALKPAYILKEDELQARHKRKLDAVENITLNQIQFAIDTLFSHIKCDKKSKLDVELLKKLLEKFVSLLGREDLESMDVLKAKDYSQRELLLLNLFCGVNVFSSELSIGKGLGMVYSVDIQEKKAFLNKFGIDLFLEMKTKEDFVDLKKSLENILEVGTPFEYVLSQGSIYGFWSDICRQAVKGKLFEDDIKKGDTSSLDSFIEEWVVSLGKVADKFGNSKTLSLGRLKILAYDLWYGSFEDEKSKNLLRKTKTENTEREDESFLAEKTESNFSSFEIEVGDRLYDLNKKYKLSDLYQEIWDNCSEATFAEYAKTVDNIRDYFFFKMKNDKEFAARIQTIKNVDADRFAYSANLELARMAYMDYLQVEITLFGAKKMFTEDEYLLIEKLMAHRNGVGLHQILNSFNAKRSLDTYRKNKDKMSYNEDSDRLEESETEHIIGLSMIDYKERLKEMDKTIRDWFDIDKLFVGGVTEEKIVLAYKYFVSKENPHGISRLTSEGHLTHFFVRLLDGYFHEKDISKIFANLENLKNECGELFVLLKQNINICPNLAIAVRKVIESEGLSSLSLKDALKVSNLVFDQSLVSAVQKSLEYKWEQVSFSEKFELCFSNTESGISVSFDFLKKFLEEDVQTKEEYEQVMVVLEDKMTQEVEEGSVKLGAIALLETTTLQFRDSLAFLRSLLSARFSDEELSKNIYDFFQPSLGDGEKNIYDVVGVIEKAKALRRAIYNSGNLSRTALLRKILVGRGGLILKLSGRKKLMGMLQEDFLEKPEGKEGSAWEKQVSEVIGQISDAIAKYSDWEYTYMSLQAILSDYIGLPPKESTKLEDIYDVDEDLKSAEQSKDNSDHLGIELHFEEPAEFDKRIKTLSLSSSQRKEYWRYSEYIINEEMSKIRESLLKQGIFVNTVEQKRVAPFQMVKDLGSRMGALGVRFLQQLPLITEVPKEKLVEFSEIFDRVEGQTKIAAIKLLEREWPDMWESVEKVENRIGGGSIVSVFEVAMKDGSKRVLKVRNPNLNYHLSEMHSYISSIIKLLLPKNREKYTAAQLLLDDIKKWIEADMWFVDFLEKDKKFKETYDGQSFGSAYEVYVPASYGPENKYFVMEEKASGTNLTEWEKLKEEGHDMKDVVAIFIRFYLTQMQNGQMHSDVHPGNFSITSDKKLVVYDRNFYLDISNEEKILFMSLISKGAGLEQRSEKFLQYLTDGHDVSIKNLQKVKKNVESFVKALESQDSLTAQRELVAIKSSGIQVPLNFTLLLKNISVLQGMAYKAGFKGLFEALQYKS
ncbi:MAG: hypothetical protein COX80_02850 [Candidatus Magasanikbacteria bacterium CG_4_10_14_0_2_um_filter_33_14]|uniref:Uncharacterized protein n=1 Tax=Candidatus Magasanikbacteria bacterium CG_4_10_14_0_2_um_filter_33_14 TaxID=1974636 RepID=A0A2M7VAM7_9BACT|nr:MAG: hypothetical protein COX80_02850 [Candidatus Magasanikbacteria bacterium CG_4_10_14_0_2_um_filter_33_14]